MSDKPNKQLPIHKWIGKGGDPKAYPGTKGVMPPIKPVGKK